jgi:hypothetical protein
MEDDGTAANVDLPNEPLTYNVLIEVIKTNTCLDFTRSRVKIGFFNNFLVLDIACLKVSKY